MEAHGMEHSHDDVLRKVRLDLPTDELLCDLSDLFKLFGDTTRIKILYSLFESEMCVCAIADLLGMTQSAISHQLKTLKDANLVGNRRDGKTIYYFLSDEHVRTIIAKGFEHLIEEREEQEDEKADLCCRPVLKSGKTKKAFKLDGLDCANCAAKIENSIRKIPGVNSASVSFITQKLVIDADEAIFDKIMQQVVKVIKKVEPDCTILM